MATKTKLITVKVTPEEKELIDEQGGPTKVLMRGLYECAPVLDCPYCGTTELLCGYPDGCCTKKDK